MVLVEVPDGAYGHHQHENHYEDADEQLVPSPYARDELEQQHIAFRRDDGQPGEDSPPCQSRQNEEQEQLQILVLVEEVEQGEGGLRFKV